MDSGKDKEQSPDPQQNPPCYQINRSLNVTDSHNFVRNYLVYTIEIYLSMGAPNTLRHPL